MKKSLINPTLQCSVCGQWKRLTRTKNDENRGLQTFYPVCEDGKGKIFNHEKNVCDKCCKKNCPYRVANTEAGVEASIN